MNRKSARKKSKDAATRIEALEQQVMGLTHAKEQLLDVVNAAVLQAGGRIEVPLGVLREHQRRQVMVDTFPPDPNVAGDSGRIVIALEGYKPEKEVESVVKRMKDLGIWLPEQEGRA